MPLSTLGPFSHPTSCKVIRVTPEHPCRHSCNHLMFFCLARLLFLLQSGFPAGFDPIRQKHFLGPCLWGPSFTTHVCFVPKRIFLGNIQANHLPHDVGLHWILSGPPNAPPSHPPSFPLSSPSYPTGTYGLPGSLVPGSLSSLKTTSNEQEP